MTVMVTKNTSIDKQLFLFTLVHVQKFVALFRNIDMVFVLEAMCNIVKGFVLDLLRCLQWIAG